MTVSQRIKNGDFLLDLADWPVTTNIPVGHWFVTTARRYGTPIVYYCSLTTLWAPGILEITQDADFTGCSHLTFEAINYDYPGTSKLLVDNLVIWTSPDYLMPWTRFNITLPVLSGIHKVRFQTTTTFNHNLSVSQVSMFGVDPVPHFKPQWAMQIGAL